MSSSKTAFMSRSIFSTKRPQGVNGYGICYNALGKFANDGRGNVWTVCCRCEEPAIYSFIKFIGIVSLAAAIGLDHPASGINQNLRRFAAKRPLAPPCRSQRSASWDTESGQRQIASVRCP